MTYEDRNNALKADLHPAMQIKLLQLEDRLLLIAEDILYTHGWRSAEEQDQLWRIGRDKNGKVIGQTVTDAKGGWSFHNFGVAVDFAPVAFLLPLSARGPLAWYSVPRFKQVASEAKKMGFTWGGDWPDRDYGHLEYTQGLSIVDFRKGKTLSFEVARGEYLADLIDQLERIERALRRKNVAPRRKIELTLARERLSRKIERIRSVVG